MTCPYIIVDRMKDGKRTNQVHIHPSEYQHKRGKNNVTWENPTPCEGKVQVAIIMEPDGACSNPDFCSQSEHPEMFFTCTAWRDSGRYGLRGIKGASDIEIIVQEYFDGKP